MYGIKLIINIDGGFVPTAGGCIVIERHKWAVILEIYCA
jgi:hypothetical protein